jgi:alginate O-acetyltransferase complex protein AlgI
VAFSTVLFLCYFFPAAIVGYFIIRRISQKQRWSNLFIVIASLYFYYLCGGIDGLRKFLLLIVINLFFVYLIKIYKTKIALTVGVVFDCFVLFKYKYPSSLFDLLFVDEDFWGGKSGSAVYLIGISFIIFSCISFLVDSYRCVDKSDNKIDFDTIINDLTYLVFFPKLIQGPIVRFSDMKSEIVNRSVSADDIYFGFTRVSYGVGKKLLIADQMGQTISSMQSVSAWDTPSAWLYVVMYGLQLYVDFSAYSDIAIGVSRIFGFHFGENFDFPYLSTSVTEFWRRWHISLGAWFREYVYFPLGGSRSGNVYVNLLIVFILTGMWHGNTKIFLCWGLGHGIFVLLERTPAYKKIRSRMNAKVSAVIGWSYTTLVVFIGWLCFTMGSVSNFFSVLKTLLGVPMSGTVYFTFEYFWSIKTAVLIIVTVAGILLLSRAGVRDFLRRFSGTKAGIIINIALSVLLLVMSFCATVYNGYTPFMYFRF